MKKILITTSIKFWFESRGDENRIASICKYLLKKEFEILLFYNDSLSPDHRQILKEKFGKIKVFSLDEAPTGNIFNRIFNLSSRIYYAFRKLLNPPKTRSIFSILFNATKNRKRKSNLTIFFSEKSLRYFREVYLKNKPDIVLVEYIILSYLVQKNIDFFSDNVLKIIDTHDIMHERCEAFKKHGQKHWVDITEDEEKEALECFDVLIAIQNKEAEKLHAMLPDKKVITAGYLTKIKAPVYSDNKTVNILYLGTESLPNKKGIEFFLMSVWPSLIDRFKDKINLQIHGNVCRYFEDSGSRNVEFKGFTDSLDDIYNNGDIVISPVFFGGGLKIKNVEALCHSKSLVTTTFGAIGIENGINKAFLVCDSAESMIKDISLVIENPEKRTELANAAYEFSKRTFGEETIYRELLDAING